MENHPFSRAAAGIIRNENSAAIENKKVIKNLASRGKVHS